MFSDSTSIYDKRLNEKHNLTLGMHYKMLSYRRETALQGAL